MNRHPVRLLAVLVLLQSAPLRADLRDSDDELTRHLLLTDPVLARAGECRDTRVERSSEDGIAWFTLFASCPAPPPEDDCPEYRVTARGTVDTAVVATVRDLRLRLECTDGPVAAARVGDGFAGPFDPVTAVALVYGRVPWRDTPGARADTVENGEDFIEPLFDEAWVEQGVEKHIVIATLTPRPRSQYNCHACPPMLGGAIFRRDGDQWRIESVGPEIEMGHAWFDGRHGRLGLIAIGDDRYGLLHEYFDIGGGYEHRRTSLIFGVDGVLASRFSLRVPETGDSAGPGACPVPDQSLSVRPAGDGAVGPGYFDLVVEAKWNRVTCRTNPSPEGLSISVSGEACQRTSRYRFEDGEYRLLGGEPEVCTTLPETTTSLRG